MIKNLEKLSKIQKRLLFYILTYTDEFKYSPTREEMAEYFSIVRRKKFSRQWAEYHLAYMERLGIVRIKRDGTRRNVKVIVKEEDREVLRRENVN